MKNMTKRLLALLLAAGTMVSLAACSTGDGGEETKENGTGSAVTEEDTGYKPDIEKTDYDEEFVFLNCSSILADGLFWVDETKRGDPMADSVYERALNIKEHLGVTLTLEQEEGDYATDVRTMVQAGEDAYQLVLSHGTIGAGSMVSSNVLYDFSNFADIDLSAPYWNQEIMEMARIGDRYLLGYGDFSLSHVHCLIFNKDMMK
jgi:ABC-type glycerol-3-phosphate transport system substrate-binding protein